MPVGFQSINDSNVLQIDGRYKNLSLIRSGSVTPTSGEASISINASAGEILAVSCTDKFTLYWSTSNEALIRINGSTSAPVKYYVFGISSFTSNYGLQVFDDAGQVVYDTGRKPFNVVDIITSYTTKNYSLGRNYAAVFISQRSLTTQNFIPQGGGGVYLVSQTYETDFAQISSNTVTTSFDFASIISGLQFISPPIPPNGNFGNDLTIKMMILDVTGY